MIFKNAFHLLIDNFALNYKYLLYKLIVVAISVGLAAAFVVPNAAFLFSSEPFGDVIGLIKDFFKALVSGDTVFLNGFSESLKTALSDLGSYIAAKTSNWVLLAVAAAAVILIYRFLSGLGNFVFGGLVDDKMSSYAKTSFSGAFIRNLGRASLWQLIYVPVTFVYDALMLVLCYLFFLTLLNVISFTLLASALALMLSVTLLLVAQAVKLSVFNGVVPALVSDKLKLSAALKKGFSHLKGRFGALFSTYLATSLIILCMYMVAGVFTFGAGLLLAVPVSYLMLICIQFVSYYMFEGKKYFIAKDKIIQPEKDKKEEDFYDDFDL